MGDPAYETQGVSLDPARTALIGMHCWDIGCEGGTPIDPAFCVGMGTHVASEEADRIMRECIRPAMAAAREAGILVCHVESMHIGGKHPEAREDLDPPRAAASPPEQVVRGWRQHIVDRSHGKDYPTASPYARMDRAKAAAVLPGEPFVCQTGQFDRALRRRGIENLIYTGFATDMCILRSEGGVEAMAPLGYRIFLMRDATLGIEFPDTFDQRVATQWAIRYFETHYGDTIELADFLRGCGRYDCTARGEKSVAARKAKGIPPPPKESDPDEVKAEYYTEHDPVDLLDAGYLEEDGIYHGDECVVDLRPERGFVRIPVKAKVAHQLHDVARRSGCTPSDLATRWLAEDLRSKSREWSNSDLGADAGDSLS